MTQNCAYMERLALDQECVEIASHRDLEFQDTLLDVVAVISATEPSPAVPLRATRAARPALTLHWILREIMQRKK